MEAPHAYSENIQSRLSEMRHRISAKKNTADVLFFGPKTAPQSNEEQLQQILETLQKQQATDGSLDSTLH